MPGQLASPDGLIERGCLWIWLHAEFISQHLAELFPANAFYPVHLNLIRLGREICHARRPECPECPFMDECNYYIARSRNSAGGSELTENKTATEGKLDG